MRFSNFTAALLAFLSAIALMSPLAMATSSAGSSSDDLVSVIISYYRPGSAIGSTTSGTAAAARTLSAADLTRALTAPSDTDVVAAAMGTSESGSVGVTAVGAYTSGTALADAVRSAGGDVKYTYTIIDAVAASVTQEVADRLRKLQAANAGIKDVEVDGIVHTMKGDAAKKKGFGIAGF
ncbi:hypothetical protein BC828DRAFT_403419 [Blastocladiella britannica]|nr:hypothetical protein BC828DRAFT_403419 [Blastocladiella britannica]